MELTTSLLAITAIAAAERLTLQGFESKPIGSMMWPWTHGRQATKMLRGHLAEEQELGEIVRREGPMIEAQRP